MSSQGNQGNGAAANNSEQGPVTNNGDQPPAKYNGADGVKLKPDGTVDLSTVNGIDSLQPQAGVDISGMHPEVAGNMGAMAKEYEMLTGQKLGVSEGYRSYAEQVRVKAKYGSEAATPGHSSHGVGITFDIPRSQIQQVEANLRAKGQDPSAFFSKYGFTRTVSGEP